MKNKNEKLFLLDGYALAYRAYYAFIKNPLTNSKGENTSAVYGFALNLLKILKEEAPQYLGVALDSSGPTFRHKIYTEYKATRQKMPDDLRYQIPWLKELLSALNIPVFEMPGYEADDIVGTLSMKAKEAGFEVYLATGDKDFTQLVGDSVYFYNIRTKEKDGEEKILDPEGVKEKMGVLPGKVAQLLALEGDSSDNIPGIPRVGRKTALKLFSEYGDLAGILENADSIKGKLGETIRENKHLALLSLELATIKQDLDIDFVPEDFRCSKPDPSKLAALLSSLDFHSLIDRFEVESGAARYDIETQEYQTITEIAELDELIENLSEQKFFVFDTETTSLDSIKAELVGISFAWQENKAFYLPVVAMEGEYLDIKYLIEKIKPLMENERILKGGQNLKYDISILKNYGVEVRGALFDTLIASYLLSPEYRKHNLDTLALDYLDYRKIPTTDLIGSGKKMILMSEVPLDKSAVYGCEDADITLRLKNLLSDSLESKGLEKLFTEIEMPLVKVLADMERTGVTIDTEMLTGMSVTFETELKGLTSGIYNLAGVEFNIDSPQQLGRILFEKMEIHKETGGRVRKTKIGYSTDVKVLKQYSKHPIVEKVMNYRHLKKLKSTYIDALPLLVNEKTGKIHTSYNQAVAATGRLSSSNPNLQNIPIRTELGRKIREAFIPSSENGLILSADYSQIEFRVAAHLSGDKRLIDFFASGKDVHAQIAGLIYDLPVKDITRDQRSRAKEISFGIMYGMNQYGLAGRLKISPEEAEEFLRNYFQMLPGISEYIQNQLTRARKSGYVETLYGRRRPVADIDSSNARQKSYAEHIAVNTPIQGTAADIIKIAMINIWEELNRRKLETKMIMQVHDELVFDTFECEINEVKAIVSECMEGAADLKVPLEVDIGVGDNWLEAH